MPVATAPDARRAVVIGAGPAGLLAARVLSRHGVRVTVLDREPAGGADVDRAPDRHDLWPRGAEIVDDLFPGLRADLLAEGAALGGDPGRARIVTRSGLLPLGTRRTARAGSGPPGVSRALLVRRLRAYLAREGAVRFVDGADAVGPVPSAPDARGRLGVGGVRVRHRGETSVLTADLVVDASGRRSRTPVWLEELGYGPAPEETVVCDLTHASRVYARPAGFPEEFSAVTVAARLPHQPRAGLLRDLGDGRWQVSLDGVGGASVPTDDGGFLRWAAALPDPSVYEAIRVAHPLGPIRGWRTPTRRWRHFERMPAWPAGLVVLGGAVATLDPTHGQDTTVAAMQAAQLAAALVADDLLADEARTGRGERRVQRRVARTVAGPWLLAGAEDRAGAGAGVVRRGARPPRGTAPMRRYLRLALRAAVDDPVLARRYLATLAMSARPTGLLAPSAIARVLGHALARTFTPPAGGAAEPRFALSPGALAAVRAMPGHPGSRHPAAGQDQAGRAQHGEVGERVAVDDEQVRAPSRDERAGVVEAQA